MRLNTTIHKLTSFLFQTTNTPFRLTFLTLGIISASNKRTCVASLHTNGTIFDELSGTHSKKNVAKTTRMINVGRAYFGCLARYHL